MVSRGQNYQLRSSFVCGGQAWSADVKLGQSRSVVVSSGQPSSDIVSRDQLVSAKVLAILSSFIMAR